MTISYHIKDSYNRYNNLKKDLEREGYRYFSKDVHKMQLRAAKNQASMRHIGKAHVVHSTALSKKRNLLPAFNQQAETAAAVNSSLQQHQHAILNQEEEQNHQQQPHTYQYHPYQDHQYFSSNQDFQQQFDDDDEEERQEYDIDDYDDLFNNHDFPSEHYYEIFLKLILVASVYDMVLVIAVLKEFIILVNVISFILIILKIVNIVKKLQLHVN